MCETSLLLKLADRNPAASFDILILNELADQFPAWVVVFRILFCGCSVRGRSVRDFRYIKFAAITMNSDEIDIEE